VSETAKAPELERLAELEAATKEYAEFSRESVGLAGVAGAVVLAAKLSTIWLVGARWDAVVTVLLPLLWLVALQLGRSSYQRGGAVIASPRRGWGRRADLGLVHLGVSLAVLQLVMQGEPTSEDGALYLTAFLAALLVVPGLVGLASASVRGRGDSMITVALAFPPHFLRLFPLSGTFNKAQSLALGILLGGSAALVIAGLAVTGVQQHRAFRRLERRLAVLRSGALPGRAS
jgi:hypothetical protein